MKKLSFAEVIRDISDKQIEKEREKRLAIEQRLKEEKRLREEMSAKLKRWLNSSTNHIRLMLSQDKDFGSYLWRLFQSAHAHDYVFTSSACEPTSDVSDDSLIAISANMALRALAVGTGKMSYNSVIVLYSDKGPEQAGERRMYMIGKYEARSILVLVLMAERASEFHQLTSEQTNQCRLAILNEHEVISLYKFTYSETNQTPLDEGFSKTLQELAEQESLFNFFATKFGLPKE